MTFEAGLDIRLSLRNGAVEAVDIASTRLVQAAGLMAGRKPEQVTGLLPSLFALCGTAQGIAAARAFEAAAGWTAPPALEAARTVLLGVETLVEHASAILRDWPALLGEEPDLTALRPLRPLITASRHALFPSGGWATPGGGGLAPPPAALADLLRALAALRALDSEDAVPIRLMRHLAAQGLESFGASDIPLMPVGGPSDLEDRLAADRDGTYLARPDSQGRVYETGCLTRLAAYPTIAALRGRHGNSLAARFAARQVEIAEILRKLEDLAQDLTTAPTTTFSPAGTGAGIGLVEAARGLLVHRVELEEGVVRRYQILAPTEWNFHPDGPLVRGLRGAEATPDLHWRARVLAAALDPCVACSVEIAGHA